MNLSPYIQHQFNGIVWRMEIDAATGTLFTEIRNEQEKRVSFASADLSSGHINFVNLTTDERWLTGMEAAYDAVLLLHNYESAGSPAHKGLTAIDGKTGQILWSDYNRTFHHLSLNGPVCFDNRFQPRKLFITDVHTGATLRLYTASVDADADAEILLPEMITADKLTGVELPLQPVGNIVHQLAVGNNRIVSLHALKNDGLNQLLYIFSNGAQAFSDILNAGIQKLQPETFVMHRNFLIYLVNRAELKVIKF